MEASNNGEESVLKGLRDAEALVVKILTELRALRELTGENARLDQLDMVLSTFHQTFYAVTFKKHRQNLQEDSKKMGKPRRSKSV